MFEEKTFVGRAGVGVAVTGVVVCCLAVSFRLLLPLSSPLSSQSLLPTSMGMDLLSSLTCHGSVGKLFGCDDGIIRGRRIGGGDAGLKVEWCSPFMG